MFLLIRRTYYGTLRQVSCSREPDNIILIYYVVLAGRSIVHIYTNISDNLSNYIIKYINLIS